MVKQVFTVVGARPQFVKAAVVSMALEKHKNINNILIHTGQHYNDNMSDIFFRELQIKKPDYNLSVGSKGHGAQTGEMLIALEELLIQHKPALVLIYGDTNSTLAAALAAVKLHIPVAHVESGLRSFNRRMPEEINRIVADHISELLFCPTEEAMKNARKEGIDAKKLFLVGDVMYDAALHYNRLATKQSRILDTLTLTPKSYVLATIHRAENTDNPVILANLFQQLIKVAQDYPIVLPLHPRTHKVLAQEGLWDIVERAMIIIEPVGFLDMLTLEKNAGLIVTDSGGVQKEAFFNKVSCITVRDQTEWVELIESDWNILVPSAQIETLPQVVKQRFGHQGKDVELYGNGTASAKIADICSEFIERM